MVDKAREPDEYLPLSPAVLDIVLALGDDELHGNANKDRVLGAENNDRLFGEAADDVILGARGNDFIRGGDGGRRRLAPGTLYRSLRQMQERGLVAESDERPAPGLDDERRRYYRLTQLGRKVAAAEVERLEGLVRAAR